MLGSLRKYIEQSKNENHNGELLWPGTADGFPVRGPVSNLKQEEYEEVPVVFDYYSRLFDMSVDEDKQLFDYTMDRIVNGWYRLHKRIDKWSDGSSSPMVWLEWVQIYGESPHAKHPGMNNDHSPTSSN